MIILQIKFLFITDGVTTYPFKYKHFTKTTNGNGVIYISSLGFGITNDNIINILPDNDLVFAGVTPSGWIRFYKYSNGSFSLYTNDEISFKVLYV